MASALTRTYQGFRGVDFRSEECSLQRSPDSVNMWKDYKKENSVRSMPSVMPAMIGQAGKAVHGIYRFKNKILYHIGTDIFRDTIGTWEGTRVFDSAYDTPSMGFVYNDVFYFKQEGWYLQTTDGEIFTRVVPYVPTTTISKPPSGGGTTHEDVNMLTNMRKNSFIADGTSTVYHLDAENIGAVTAVTVNGEAVATEQYTVDASKGAVTFAEAPEAPATAGQDNVEITFAAGYSKDYKIYGCALATVFDNRVFFSGYAAEPNMIWHSSLDDPTYISDLDYYKEGRDEAAVKGMVAGNNALWVFREPSQENATVFYHTPTNDADYGKIYPSCHSSISTGCVGKAINFNDDIVFFSGRGMEGISNDITTEQVVAHRSSLVDRKLTAEEHYKDMVLIEWEGYLAVCVGGRVYLADSRGKWTNGDHLEYEWFYWDFGDYKITCAAVEAGRFLLGTESGIILQIDPEKEGTRGGYWVTSKDKFQYPNRLKTTNKRGCVIEGTGDFRVLAKTEDAEFEEAGSYKGVKDYAIPRIKRKKFKDIQLKIESDSAFSLELITLECFVGGYIKR